VNSRISMNLISRISRISPISRILLSDHASTIKGSSRDTISIIFQNTARPPYRRRMFKENAHRTFKTFNPSILSLLIEYRERFLFRETLHHFRSFRSHVRIAVKGVWTHVSVAGGSASAGDPAFDGGGDGGAAPSSDPWCGCCADGAASSPDAGDTGRDDADEDGRRAAGSSPSTGTRQGCDKPTCRALLSNNQWRRSIRKRAASVRLGATKLSDSEAPSSRCSTMLDSGASGLTSRAMIRLLRRVRAFFARSRRRSSDRVQRNVSVYHPPPLQEGRLPSAPLLPSLFFSRARNRARSRVEIKTTGSPDDR